MTDSAEGPAAIEAPAAATTRGRRLLALWAVLAVLALAAGVLVVRSRDGGRPPRLPIALGSATAEKRAAPAVAPVAGTADIALAPSLTYVAASDLPVLGGTGTAYRLGGDISAAQAAALARALGLSGSPTNVEGGWHLDSGGHSLDVSTGDGGSWWYGPQAPDAGSSSGSGGGAAVSNGVVEGGPADASTTASPPAAVSCDGGAPTTTASTGPCGAIDPVLPVPSPQPLAPDLPSEAEARRIALDLLTATGMDVHDAVVTIDGPSEAWYVSVEPQVDGVPVSGLTASVSVGSKGEVTYASGFLDHPVRLGGYPVLDTRATIDRLNAQGAGGRVAVDEAVDGAEGAATPETLVAPGLPEPSPMPTPLPSRAPQQVVLHRADRILIVVPASDSSTDSYLVPGYRFHGDDDALVDAIAVDDASLVPPPEVSDPAKVTPAVGEAKPQQ